jgi:LmbE family N-acetylglucosaminyl deacetylase
MNLPQRIVLIVGFIAILAMALFPPWVYVYDPPEGPRRLGVKVERPAGYHLVFGEHVPQDQTQLIKIFNMMPPEVEKQIQALTEQIGQTTDGHKQDQLVNQIAELRKQYPPSWYFAGLQFFSVRMDITRLAVQIGATLLLTSILYLALRRKSSD